MPATATAPKVADTYFPGEDNVLQAGVNLTTALSTTYPATAVSEAFDEPLDAAPIQTIATMFTSAAGKANGLLVQMIS